MVDYRVVYEVDAWSGDAVYAVYRYEDDYRCDRLVVDFGNHYDAARLAEQLSGIGEPDNESLMAEYEIGKEIGWEDGYEEGKEVGYERALQDVRALAEEPERPRTIAGLMHERVGCDLR